ncbi:MAG: hypothetical protein LBG65_06055 [Puniceicoccales bacterium]|jgi:hypothetical protein|nr:hypothetical protein [Puniceicoccales bacterium]
MIPDRDDEAAADPDSVFSQPLPPSGASARKPAMPPLAPIESLPAPASEPPVSAPVSAPVQRTVSVAGILQQFTEKVAAVKFPRRGAQQEKLPFSHPSHFARVPTPLILGQDIDIPAYERHGISLGEPMEGDATSTPRSARRG